MQNKLQWGKKKWINDWEVMGGGGPRRRDSECVQGHPGAGASIRYLDSGDGFTAVLRMSAPYPLHMWSWLCVSYTSVKLLGKIHSYGCCLQSLISSVSFSDTRLWAPGRSASAVLFLSMSSVSDVSGTYWVPIWVWWVTEGTWYPGHVTHRQPSLVDHLLFASTLLRYFIHLLNVLFERDNLFGPI